MLRRPSRAHSFTRSRLDGTSAGAPANSNAPILPSERIHVVLLVLLAVGSCAALKPAFLASSSGMNFPLRSPPSGSKDSTVNPALFIAPAVKTLRKTNDIATLITTPLDGDVVQHSQPANQFRLFSLKDLVDQHSAVASSCHSFRPDGRPIAPLQQMVQTGIHTYLALAVEIFEPAMPQTEVPAQPRCKCCIWECESCRHEHVAEISLPTKIADDRRAEAGRQRALG